MFAQLTGGGVGWLDDRRECSILVHVRPMWAPLVRVPAGGTNTGQVREVSNSGLEQKEAQTWTTQTSSYCGE